MAPVWRPEASAGKPLDEAARRVDSMLPRPEVTITHRRRKVLILSTIDVFTLGVVRTAVLAGYRPYVVTDRRWDWLRLSVHAQRRLIQDHDAFISGAPEALNAINRFIQCQGIDLVVAADTRCTRMLAGHAGEIRNAALFPLPSVELFDRMYDKWSFYQLLTEHGISTPRTILVSAPDDVGAVDLDYPVIVKPAWGESGQGVHRIDTQDALRKHLRNAGTAFTLVQQFIPGRDIDLNLCADRGELTTWLVQMREDGGMRFPDDDRVVALGRDICRAAKYHGVAHIDMRIDERTGQVKVIEFNPRFWGSMIYASWMGVNFLEAGVSILDQFSRPDFQPVSGFCPFLGASPGVLARWAIGGFRLQSHSSAQRTAWSMQVLDPLPEWLDWARNLRQRLGPHR
jgi:hypothetical protein